MRKDTFIAKIFLVFLSMFIILTFSSAVMADENITDVGNTIIVDGSGDKENHRRGACRVANNRPCGEKHGRLYRCYDIIVYFCKQICLDDHNLK